MSHICIISESKKSHSMACYQHIKNRGCFDVVSMLYPSDDMTQFLQNNQVDLMILEDENCDAVFQCLQKTHPKHQCCDVLIIGELAAILPNVVHQIFSLPKEKPLRAVLDLIDLIALQIHMHELDLPNHKNSTIIKRFYQAIRYVEYSEQSICYHLNHSTHELNRDYLPIVPVMNHCFFPVNDSILINMQSVTILDKHVLITNQNETIEISAQHREELWVEMCHFSIPEHICRLVT